MAFPLSELDILVNIPILLLYCDILQSKIEYLTEKKGGWDLILSIRIGLQN